MSAVELRRRQCVALENVLKQERFLTGIRNAQSSLSSSSLAVPMDSKDHWPLYENAREVLQELEEQTVAVAAQARTELQEFFKKR